MEYTTENIENVADKIVDHMSTTDLCQYVYEDLVALMEKDQDIFEVNCENYLD